MYDLVIRDATIVTMDAQRRIVPHGMVGIRGRDIIYVGPEKDLEAERVIDVHGAIVMPGLINAHTHAAMTLFRGIADDVTLQPWLERFTSPLESIIMTPENVALGAFLACAEMIRGGTTLFVDGYHYADRTARVVAQVGMRAFVGESVSDTYDVGLTRSRALLETWTGHERIIPVLAPHTPATCGPDVLKGVVQLAQQFNARMHIHLAETRAEKQVCLDKYGLAPIAYLTSSGLFAGPVLASHGVWLEPADIDVLARARARVVLVSESNMKLADGSAPWPALASSGIPLCLGTDGAASNNSLDMFRTMDITAKLFKYAAGDPAVINARQVVEMATCQAAHALEIDDIIGSLEPGKRADLIVVDTHGPHMVPLYDVYSALVYAAKSSDVTSVMVDGRLLMHERQLLTMDERAIIEQARQVAQDIAVVREGL